MVIEGAGEREGVDERVPTAAPPPPLLAERVPETETEIDVVAAEVEEAEAWGEREEQAEEVGEDKASTVREGVSVKELVALSMGDCGGVGWAEADKLCVAVRGCSRSMSSFALDLESTKKILPAASIVSPEEYPLSMLAVSQGTLGLPRAALITLGPLLTTRVTGTAPPRPTLRINVLAPPIFRASMTYRAFSMAL